MNATKIEYDLDDPTDASLYDNILYDIYGETVNICGLNYDTLHALKKVDPTAYRCGAHDFFDGLDERWDCECGMRYDNEEEAEECCKDEELEILMDKILESK